MIYNHFSYQTLNLFFFYLQQSIKITVYEKEICKLPSDVTFPLIFSSYPLFLLSFLLTLFFTIFSFDPAENFEKSKGF